MAQQHGCRAVGYVEVPGRGGGMQLLLHAGHIYMGHLSPGGGTSIVDVREPSRPRVVGGLPGPAGTYSPKVQIGDGLLLVNFEQRDVPAERHGLGVYDLSDPAAPREIGFYDTGGRGIHRMWYTGGRYAYLSGVPEGFADRMLTILDLADPRHPVAAGRWWLPGLWTAGGERRQDPEGLKHNLHHAIVWGDRAYMGCWDLGLVILDIAEPGRPREVGRATGWAPAAGGNTHTALPLPGRRLLATTDEATDEHGGDADRKFVRLFDIADETRPRELSRCPGPDVPHRGGRFGPHNLHENRPGSFRGEDRLFVSYFGGGLAVYDISDPLRPTQVAGFVPDAPPGRADCQTNDLFVDERGLVYLSDRRHGCLHVVEMTV